MENGVYKVKKEDGSYILVETLGFFEVPELEKEYVMHSILDDKENTEMGAIMISEVIKLDNGEVEIKDIEEDEIDLVMAFYNEIEKQVGGNS